MSRGLTTTRAGIPSAAVQAHVGDDGRAQAWLDYDRQRLPSCYAGEVAGAVLVHRISPRSIHVLTAEHMDWTRLRVIAEHTGGDTRAIAAWARRGSPSLRVTRRPGEAPAAHLHGTPAVWRRADPGCVATIAVYLAHWQHHTLARRLQLLAGRTLWAAARTEQVRIDTYFQAQRA